MVHDVQPPIVNTDKPGILMQTLPIGEKNFHRLYITDTETQIRITGITDALPDLKNMLHFIQIQLSGVLGGFLIKSHYLRLAYSKKIPNMFRKCPF